MSGLFSLVKVIAEGVEKFVHMEYLRQQGCEFDQGYFIGRPQRQIFCPASITKSLSLVVGLPKLEPYATQRGSEISGLYAEILEEVFSNTGVDYTMRLRTPARMVHEFMNGSLYVIIVLNNMSTISKVAYLTKEPLNSVRMMLMKREDRPLEPISRAQRIRTSIAAIRGFSPESRIFSKSCVELVNSREQFLKILFAGRVDYIVAD